ncbi:MAG: hypothetical protein HC820_04340, partial [Hydrococcus sp. RM1_1_31]|nr:hypothetical protein [Hydrococcus sp. RM1_1_31]
FLRAAGRTQEYVRVAERLLYHRPVDAVIRELVRAYLELNEPRRALMKLNELLGRQNHDPEGLELLAETFVRLEKVDKACSVVLELVKHHRDNGPEAVQLCVTLLRRAATWAPNNQKVKQALDELAPQAPAPSVETDAFDEIDEDFEELDDFDEVEDFEELTDDDDDEPPPPTKPPPKRPRVPQPPPARLPPISANSPSPRSSSSTKRSPSWPIATRLSSSSCILVQTLW